MGSQAIQFVSQFPIPIAQNHYHCINYTNCKTRRKRCFSGGGSRRDREKNVNPNRTSRFSEAFVTDDYDEEDEFGFRNASKRRTWWSDDDDDDDDEGFGTLEASIGFNWVFKVFRAFGWMIPAIIISLLLGTGPNAIVMALALPLAQSALSLAAETFWGRPNDIPRPKSKSKRRPFSGSRGRNRVRKEKEKETGNYKTWVDANNVSSKSEERKTRNFGGWDELDNQVRVDMGARVKKEDEARGEERVEISRRIKGDTPLVLRLLIATFPFLGFWIKLL